MVKEERLLHFTLSRHCAVWLACYGLQRQSQFLINFDRYKSSMLYKKVCLFVLAGMKHDISIFEQGKQLIICLK